jgi:hypothetical protein
VRLGAASRVRLRSVEQFASERGAALIVALLSTSMLLALGVSLVLTTMGEGTVAAYYRDGVEAAYAAEAAAELAIAQLGKEEDWDGVLSGIVRSAFVDGSPSGTRRLAGRVLDLSFETGLLRCGKAVCTDDDMDGVTDERPWGKNNPRWQLYAYGPLRALAPGAIDSRMYILVWVGDDGLENDGDPSRDDGPAVECGGPGPPCANLGSGVLDVRAWAFGPGGVQRGVEVTLARTDMTDGGRVLSWRAVR